MMETYVMVKWAHDKFESGEDRDHFVYSPSQWEKM